jgi:AbrB family looped-hinge helix DNA binding protein
MKTSARVKLNEQGRLVIPAELRCLAGLTPGDTVIVRAVGDHIEILSEAAIFERIQAAAGRYEGRTLPSEELIAERRAEAEREANP